ncbi:MAG: 16S rRNA processing protein RimM [Chloroflexi bacterium]|nr:16S rRNA processing protein RimM [Chloroflexota bacterium]
MERKGKPKTPRYLAVGRIISPHGIRGEVEVDVHTDFPQRFQPGARFLVGERKSEMTVESVRPYRKRLLIKFREIPDRTRADVWRGAWIHIPVEEAWPLEEDEYYEYQILGLDVWSDEGEYLGQVDHIIYTGANDVYVIRGPEGEILLPAIKDVILDVDLEKGRMTVHLLPGLVETTRRS